MKTIIKTLLLVLFIILTFTGCENFLTGSSLKNELEEKIKYENAESVIVKFKANQGNAGSFLTGEKSVKIGFKTEIQFNISSQYEYEGLVITRSSDGLLLDNIAKISLTSSDYEQNSGIYKYDFTLLQKETDVLVLAKCHLKTDNIKPVVKSVDIYNTEDKANPYYRQISNKLYSADEWTDELYHTNHVENLWVEIEGIDADSGIEKVCIKETLLKDSENNVRPVNTYVNYYGLDSDNNSLFLLTDQNIGIYKYAFNYRFFGATEGIVQLEFSLIDKAGNESKVSDNITYEVVRSVQNDDIFKIQNDLSKYNSPTNTNYNFVFFHFNPTMYFKSDIEYVNERVFSLLIKYKDESEYTTIVDKQLISRATNYMWNTTPVNSVLDFVNNAFEAKKFMYDYTKLLDIKICEWWENGTYKEYEYTNPAAIKPFVLDYNSKYSFYFFTLSDSLICTANSRYCNLYYTYQENENSTESQSKKISPEFQNKSKINFKSNSEKLIFDGNGIYNFYIENNWVWNNQKIILTAPRGEPLVYYYNYNPITPPSITFPVLNKDNVSYAYNSDYTKLIINIDADLPEDGLDYYFRLEDNNIIYTKNKKIELNPPTSTNTYKVSIIVLNEDGRLLKESDSPYSLVVGSPPSLIFGSNNQDYYISSGFIEKASFHLTRLSRYPESFDYYFVPAIYGNKLTEDYVTSNYTKYTYKNNILNDSVADRMLYYNGLENGSYYLYVTAKDSVDSNFKYFECQTYKGQNAPVVINKALINEKPAVTTDATSVKISIPAYSVNLKNKVPDFYKYIEAYKSTEYDRKQYTKETINYFSLKNNEWKLKDPVQMTPNGTDTEYTFTLSDLADDSDFICMYANYYYYREYRDYNENSACFYLPVYICPKYYKDSLSCDSKSWVTVDNGKFIFCDAPTLAHTLYSPKKLTDTNTEQDASYWEAQGQETGILLKDKNFSYTSENLDAVPVGCFYTTVVHFADGTVLMTVPEKKVSAN